VVVLRLGVGVGVWVVLWGVTLSVAMAAYVVVLERRWKLTAADARRIGATWLLLTLAFEFGFGRFVDHKTWSELFHDYNLLRGRTWPLVLAFLAALPLLARELRRRTGV
jgi:urea transporter